MSAASPIFLTTWQFSADACRTGIEALRNGNPALDAVEIGANRTERDPAANSVGYGGLPNAEGVVELDAAIMDGPTHSAGAVAGLTGFRTPISVARRVMTATPHVLLVGENARRFALSQGFPEEELLTPASKVWWEQWKANNGTAQVAHFDFTSESHDTIGLCALDQAGNLAVGCTTSGKAGKIPGRVGDSPIIGSGLYVDNAVGAASATGDGDEMMKACLAYRVVSLMEQGQTPREACVNALRYLLRKRPPELHNHYGAALIALRQDGLFGAAATASGFSLTSPWQWIVAAGETGLPTLHNGPYITSEAVLETLS